MNITKQQIDKIDPQLCLALRSAKEEDPLRAIVLIGPKRPGIKQSMAANDIRLDAFASYEDYRMALLKRREEQVADEIKEVVEKLQQQFHLKTRVSRISKNITIEGAAQEILRLLELPEVQHASLDQSITLIKSRHPRPKKTPTESGPASTKKKKLRDRNP